MAQHATKRSTSAADALRALEARVSRIDDAGERRRPELMAIREQLRQALRSHAAEAHRLLGMVAGVAPYGFGTDPEFSLLHLADAVEELEALVSKLGAVGVRS